MSLRKLTINRYEKSKDKNENYSFGVKILNKELVYLTTNQFRKESIENWKNNFYSAFRWNRKGIEGFILFSIEGITIYDKKWKHRKDIITPRTEELYQTTSRLIKTDKRRRLEKLLINLIYED